MMKTTAYVEVKVKVECSGGWSARCTIEEVRKTASRSAIEAINIAFQKTGTNIKVIGTPAVTIINIDE
jgi:hypothetical protein